MNESEKPAPHQTAPIDFQSRANKMSKQMMEKLDKIDSVHGLRHVMNRDNDGSAKSRLRQAVWAVICACSLSIMALELGNICSE